MPQTHGSRTGRGHEPEPDSGLSAADLIVKSAGGGSAPPPPPRPSPTRGEGANSPAADPVTRTRPPEAGPPESVADEPDWKVGDIIDGKYEVTELIGRGGMGIVFKVRHREWNIDLAVKMPLARMTAGGADGAGKARFVREAQAWVNLGSHPNIVQCWYVRELAGMPRLFMDYLPGGSLRKRIKEGKIAPDDWHTIIDLMVQACDGLGYAHETGVVHRDVQPANMLLDADGRLCVSDFGLVKVGDLGEIERTGDVELTWDPAELGLTISGSVLGTPEYGAPEQWGEARHADARADIYALGVTLYELLCGRRPFDDGSHAEPPSVLIGRHISTPAPSPRRFRRDVPEALAQLALKCLEKDPDHRFRDMRALRKALARVHALVLGQLYTRPPAKAEEARADSLNNKAVSLFDLGRREEAQAAWEEALRLDAGHPEAVYNSRLLEWRDGEIDDLKAVSALREAKRAHRRAGLYLGCIHLERMAADEAEEELADAVQDVEVAANGSAWRALGDARLACGKSAQAAEAYTKALELMPGDAGALAGLAAAEGWAEGVRAYSPSPLVGEGRGGGAARAAGSHPPPQPSPTWGEGVYVTRRCRAVLEGHRDDVNAVAVTADGRVAVSGSADRTLRVWDLENGRCMAVLEGHTDSVNAVAITTDGRYAVSGGSDRTVRWWDLYRGRCLRTMEGHRDWVTTIALTGDGQRAISGSPDKTVRIWFLGTGLALKTLDIPDGWPITLDVTSDGRYAVTGSPSRMLRWWDLETGRCAWTLRGHTDGVKAVAATPDGRLALSAAADRTVRVWDLLAGRPLRTLKGLGDWGMAAAITPDGRFGLAGSADRTLRLWDLGSGRCLRSFTGHTSAVKAVAVTPEGAAAVTGGADKTVRVWDLGAERTGPATSLMVSRAGTHAVIREAANRFRRDLAAARAAMAAGDDRAALENLTRCRAIRGFERDAKALALNAELAGRLTRRGLRAGWLLRTLTGHTAEVNAVAAGSDGRRVLSGGCDGSLRWWDIASGECVRTIPDAGWVSAVAVTPDGRCGLARGESAVSLWDLRDGGCVRTIRVGEHWGRALAVSGDGKAAWLWGREPAAGLSLWNLAEARCRQTLPAEADDVECLALSADGRTALAAGAGRALNLWDLRAGKVLRTLRGHEKAVNSVAITADGRFAVSAGKDQSLRHWDLSAGRCLRVLRDHDDAVNSVALTADGRFAVSGSDDTTVRLWDLARGACIKTFEGHVEAVNAVAFTPDGRFAISGSDDRSLRVWELDWDLEGMSNEQ